MSPVSATGKAAGAAVEALKEKPLALALVVINVLFLAAGIWMLRELGQATERRDALISQLVRDCSHAPAPKAAP